MNNNSKRTYDKDESVTYHLNTEIIKTLYGNYIMMMIPSKSSGKAFLPANPSKNKEDLQSAKLPASCSNSLSTDE